MTDRRKAQSRYRQLRLTATQEAGGRFSWSISAKPLNAAWTQHTTLQRGQTESMEMLTSTEDVILALVVILDGLLLPQQDVDDN